MADGIVQVPPDSSGKRIDTSELVVGSQAVERQRIVVGSPTDPIALAEVVNTSLMVHVDNPPTSTVVTNFPASQHVTVDNPISSVVVSNFPATQNVAGSVSVGNFPATQNVAVVNFPPSQTVSGTVNVANFPATQPVSGSVGVTNFPAIQTVAGAVTITSGAVTVSGTVSISNFPTTQQVSGSVNVGNFPSTQVVSGTVNAKLQDGSGTLITSTGGALDVNIKSGGGTGGGADVQYAEGAAQATATGTLALGKNGSTLKALQTDSSGNLLVVQSSVAPISGTVTVANLPVTQAVTGTFWQSVQPVSGSLVVNNFPAVQTVAVNNFPATQPVSGTVAVTGTFWQTTQPVSIAAAVAVTGTFWQATQPVSGTLGSKTQDGAGTNITSTGGALDVNVKTGNVQYTAPSGVAPSVPSPTGNVIFGYNSSGKAVPILCALDGPLAVYTSNYVLSCRDQASTGVNAPLSTSASWIGGSDGTNLQGLLVDSAANKNLRVALYSAAAAITNTSGALDVNIKSGSSAGTQYLEGTTAATPTGTVAMGQNPSGIINALNTDAAGNLLISGAATAGTPTTVNIGQAAPTSAAGGTQILAAKTTRVRLLITQMSTVPVYLGTSTAVTAANGDLLPGIVGYQKVYRNTAALWGLGSGATGSISYVEEAA